jgi:hypothetical protein
MNKYRISIALLCGLCALIMVTLAFGRPAKDKISGCNSSLVQCDNRCQKYQSIYTREVCEHSCLDTWNDCMDKAGAPKANRWNPLKHKAIDSGRAPNTGTRTNPTPTPPKIGKGDKGVSGKPLTNGGRSTPTPTPHRVPSTGPTGTKPPARQ